MIVRLPMMLHLIAERADAAVAVPNVIAYGQGAE
jgi:hypothetical protein